MWSKNDISNETLNIDGNNFIRSDRPNRVGGVEIYAKFSKRTESRKFLLQNSFDSNLL